MSESSAFAACRRTAKPPAPATNPGISCVCRAWPLATWNPRPTSPYAARGETLHEKAAGHIGSGTQVQFWERLSARLFTAIVYELYARSPQFICHWHQTDRRGDSGADNAVAGQVAAGVACVRGEGRSRSNGKGLTERLASSCKLYTVPGQVGCSTNRKHGDIDRNTSKQSISHTSLVYCKRQR